MRILKRISLMFTALLIAFASMAQVTSGSITGTVNTNTGAGLEGAVVTATHTPSGTSYKTITKKGGSFNLPGIRVGGPYVVKVEYVGLKTETIQDIHIALGDPYTLSVALNDATASLTEVVVLAQRSRNVADKTGTTTVIGQRQLTTLPSISRSISDFTRLTPQAGSSTSASSQNSLGGRDGRFNNVTVDGANLNNNFGLSTDPLPGGGANPISLDAIDQISINIAPYDVRQSNFTGGNIAAVTKSGTNTFKGSAYTFYKNQAYVGTKLKDLELSALSATKSNIYGGTLGGPIIKNKLFFFVNYEYEKKTNPPATTFTPSGGSGTGNISNVKIDSLRKFSDYLKSAYGYETGAYDNFPNFASKNTKILVRLDWNISQVHKLTAKYSDLSSTNDVAMSSSIANGAATGGPNTWTSQ
ncbi:MAG: cell envelope biosis protein OmpA, partial [Sediminibacterium sp.]|nr:cell envelope biosis protein OmpA [Sediminibacterium sp.]